MKLQLIYEATIETIKRRIPVFAQKYFNGDQQKALKTIKTLINADPTNGKYVEWVIAQWKKGLTRHPEDNHRIKTTLQKFEKVKSRVPNKDINSHTIHLLEETVEKFFGIKSSTKQHEYSGLSGVKIVSEKGPYVILKVTDPISLGELGEGTKWCTRKSYDDQHDGDYDDDYYDDYDDDYYQTSNAERYINNYKHIYVVLQNGRPVMQYTPDYEQIMDINDEEVKDKKLLSLISLPLDDPMLAYSYADNVIGGRWPEAEPIIATNPNSAFLYADNVIGGRWPEAESTIAGNPRTAFWYVLKIINDYEPDLNSFGEPFTPQLKKRWPEGERAIIQDPYLAFVYARDIIGGRWPEGERAIMKSGYAEYYKEYLRSGETWTPSAHSVALSNSRFHPNSF